METIETTNETVEQQPKKEYHGNSKEYMKEYYSKNKERISKMCAKKEVCEFCKRLVTHQNMPAHQRTKYCQNRRNDKQKYTMSDTKDTSIFDTQAIDRNDLSINKLLNNIKFLCEYELIKEK